MLNFFLQLFTKTAYGLLPHKEDERDFKFSWLMGSTSYTPKHTTWEVPTISVKNQGPLNTCVWNSLTVQKEVDEGRSLSVKYVVSAAKKAGRLWGNGYATLRDGQKTLVDTGICSETLCPNLQSDWVTYSSPAALTYNNNQDAATHKSKNYFLASTQDEWLKALDDNHVIHTGMAWYTGYNSYSIKPPYVLKIGSGIPVGGHAVICKGYDMVNGVLKFQNSFGPTYGDRGCFYVRMYDWFRLGNAGYVTVDADPVNLFAAYEGKDVKGSGPAIYRIMDGKKHAYPNEQVFFKHGGRFDPNKTWVGISQSLLDSIPLGEPMG